MKVKQARWNGVDGLDERTRTPYWRIGIRHDLADAARRLVDPQDGDCDARVMSRPPGRW